jgi:hypothetical protein
VAKAFSEEFQIACIIVIGEAESRYALLIDDTATIELPERLVG